MSLDNLSISHDNLHDICKLLDDFTDDAMDDAVGCAVKIFSECMNEPEGNMILMIMLKSFAKRSERFHTRYPTTTKMKVRELYG